MKLITNKINFILDEKDENSQAAKNKLHKIEVVILKLPTAFTIFIF